MSDADTGVIYAIQAHWGGPVKIGFTRSERLGQRLSELQTGNPSRLVIRGAMAGTKATESSIHQHLAQFRAHGEWFHSGDDMWRMLNEAWDADVWLGELRDIEYPSCRFDGYRCVWGRAGSYLENREGDLRLYWEVDGDPISDNYTPDDIDAAALWNTWTSYLSHRGAGDEVQIHWFVESPSARAFEAAPFTRDDGDWLTHYTWPRLCSTSDPIRWGELPVVNKRWNAMRCDKGGFIQEHTGWKPSALQPRVSVRMLEQMAGDR